MLRSLAANGLAERAVIRTRPDKTWSNQHMLVLQLSCARHGFRRAASTSASTSPTPPSNDQPPLSDTPRRPKVELRPGPVKPAADSKPAPVPDASGTGSKPPSSPLRAVAKAEAAKAHVYTTGKAIEKMSTVETMKFDVQDATRRGILRPPPAGAGTARLFVHNMWEVLKFYGRGIKQINSNRVIAARYRTDARSEQRPLSRSETKFIRIYRQDALKLVPFVMIAVVIEEIIPLIVLYAPFMLPSTCILPSQEARIIRAKHESQLAFSTLRDYFEPVHTAGKDTGSVRIQDLSPSSLQAMCGILGLSTFGVPFMRRWRLNRKLKEVVADDAMLRAEGSGERLSETELVEALHDRGITTDTIPRPEWENKLTWWLKNADGSQEGDPIGRRLMLIATIGMRRW